MTKEIEFLPSGEIDVVLNETTYHLPRPNHGIKKWVSKRLAEVGDEIEAMGLKAQDEADAIKANLESSEDVDADTEAKIVMSFIEKLGEETFVILVGLWVEIVSKMTGEKVDLAVDDAPIWMEHLEILASLADHWNTNPLASSQNPPSLTAVK